MDFFDFVDRIISTHLFSVGDTNVTLGTLLYFFLAVTLLVYLSLKVKDLLLKRILLKYNIEIGTRHSIATITRYFILLIGLIIIFQSFGLELSALGFLFGVVGVGIGFGLQGITNNFISGVIILFERPIKVGDRVEVIKPEKKNKSTGIGINQEKEKIIKITGDVVKISARATTVVTNDNISLIVPNSHFTNSPVINWSHKEDLVRLNFPLPVSKNEDPDLVKSILMKLVDEHTGVLKTPLPDVLFEEMDGSLVLFNLHVWTSAYVHCPEVLKSQLYFSIYKAFKEHKVVIPFPQRDLNIKQ